MGELYDFTKQVNERIETIAGNNSVNIRFLRSEEIKYSDLPVFSVVDDSVDGPFGSQCMKGTHRSQFLVDSCAKDFETAQKKADSLRETLRDNKQSWGRFTKYNQRKIFTRNYAVIRMRLRFSFSN